MCLLLLAVEGTINQQVGAGVGRVNELRGAHHAHLALRVLHVQGAYAAGQVQGGASHGCHHWLACTSHDPSSPGSRIAHSGHSQAAPSLGGCSDKHHLSRGAGSDGCSRPAAGSSLPLLPLLTSATVQSCQGVLITIIIVFLNTSCDQDSESCCPREPVHDRGPGHLFHRLQLPAPGAAVGAPRTQA